MRRTTLIFMLILGSLVAMASSAGAHVSMANTSLTIKVSGGKTVAVGETITITGKLTGPPRCRPNQEIELLANGTVVDTTLTDAQGRYSFTFVVTESTTLQTRFEGSPPTGVHPHAHSCEASTSRVVRITARGNTATAGSVFSTLGDALSDVGATLASGIVGTS